MKVAICGKNGFGGREHSLAYLVKRQNPDTQLYLYPGNGGTEKLGEHRAVNSIEEMIKDMLELEIELAILGPEADLEEGLADLLRKKGIACFGPGKEGARLETNKLFAKKVMEVGNVPTAQYQYFSALQLDALLADIETRPAPYVIKANGLAAGKGVFVVNDASKKDLAIQFVKELISGGYGGSAKTGVLIENFLPGEEASLFYLVNTHTSELIPMRPSQDHKRLMDGDKGPNTGGMGAYSDAPLVTDHLLNKIHQEIAKPTMHALQALGIDYVGVLYFGLMIDAENCAVVEINARFGDPEIEVLAPRIQSNFLELLNCLANNKKCAQIEWTEEACVSVVLASEGYPTSSKKGIPIHGLNDIPEDILIFHAGTRKEKGQILTNGGRVLNVVSLGKDIPSARKRVYDFLSEGTLHFENMQYRRDIASKADRWIS